ncbi:MAG: transposase, partial [Armatimonadota bacterium]|nr:transposase [Armatimonadota bacterium]
YACIISLVNACKCEALAIGGVQDHVHLVVKAPTTISPSEIMQRVKGASSTLVRERLAPGKLFGWQEGYGVFSVSRSHVERVVNYVKNQEHHHASAKLWPEWEETGEGVESEEAIEEATRPR